MYRHGAFVLEEEVAEAAYTREGWNEPMREMVDAHMGCAV